MNAVRQGSPGATRPCPHCKAVILESASVCPACRGHLRYDEAALQRAKTRSVPLDIEGTLSPPESDTVHEYSMVLSIRNDRDEEIDRKIVGVGAMRPGEARTFTLTVEVFGDTKNVGRKH